MGESVIIPVILVASGALGLWFYSRARVVMYRNARIEIERQGNILTSQRNLWRATVFMPNDPNPIEGAANAPSSIIAEKQAVSTVDWQLSKAKQIGVKKP
jgi:hypothetical protein